jgi:hypothetical protein
MIAALASAQQSPASRLDRSPFGRQVRFTENRGQLHDIHGRSRPDLLFSTNTPEMKIFFAKKSVSYLFTRVSRSDGEHPRRFIADNDDSLLLHRVDLLLEGAREIGSIVPEEESGEQTNYYDAYHSDGITGAPGYRRLIYRNLWPQIDMVVHAGESEGLKYDFIIRPGGRVSDIRLRYDGADSVSLGRDGSIGVFTPLGDLVESAPVVYQTGRGILSNSSESDRRVIASAYRMEGGTIGFSVDRYDSSRVLVIDPALEWSTYYGGSDGRSVGTGVAVDPEGNVIVTGHTTAPGFPVSPGAWQGALVQSDEGFIAKFTSYGILIWSTFYGGESRDLLSGIAIDSSGKIFLTGETDSPGFPVTAATAFQPFFRGITDGVLVKLDTNGRRIWATFIAGDSVDRAIGVTVDHEGNVIVVGHTNSRNFPVTPGVFRSTFNNTDDLFITKFTSNGKQIWGTYYGGNGQDYGYSVASDPWGNVLITGRTGSPDFPVFGDARQSTLVGQEAAFAVKLDSSGRWQDWSTYIGGTVPAQPLSFTAGYGIAADSSGNVYIAGATNDNSFPTTSSAPQKTRGGSYDGFLIKLDTAGRRVWATYLGGNLNDYCNGLTSDRYGNIAITGATASANFPVKETISPFVLSDPNSAFMSLFDSSGAFIWGAFVGGTDEDYGNDIAVDSTGSIFIVGSTSSLDFPTLAAVQPTRQGPSDLFITKLGCAPPPEVRTKDTLFLCRGDSIPLTAYPGYRYRWSTGDTTRILMARDSGDYNYLWTSVKGCTALSGTIRVELFKSPPLAIDASKPTIGCFPDSVILSAARPYVAYHWSTGDTRDTIVIRQAGTYTLDIIDTNGCRDTVSITVKSSAIQQPVVTPLGPIPFCDGDSVTLDAGAGYLSYHWSTGDTTRTIVVRQQGNYSVAVIDSNLCSAVSDPLNVTVDPLPGTPTITQSGDTLISTQAGSYQWSLDGQPIPGATDDSLTANLEGNYRVTVTNGSGCSAISAPYEYSKTASAKVSIGEYEAAPGERLTIRLEMDTSHNFQRNGIRTFSAQLRFDNSLLLPSDRSLVTRRDGNDRIVTVDGTVPATSASGAGTLATLDVIAMLGDAVSTPLAIERIDWHEGAVRLDTSTGIFRLRGLCEQGSIRLIKGTGEPTLKPARPSPASGLTEIEYEVIEPGRMQLYLVDMLGRVIPLLDEQASAGRYITTFDASRLGSGAYSCILQTPTQRLSRLIWVER